VETDFQFSSPAAQRFLEGLGGISYGDAKDLFAIGQYLQEQAGNHSDLNLNELRDVPVGELLQRFQTVDPDSATNFSASQGGPSTWDHLKSRAGEIHNRQVEGFNNLHERQMERAGRLADWTRGAAGSTVEGVRDAAGTVGDFLERGAEEVGGRARDAFDGDNSMEGEVGTREEIPEPLAPLSDDEGLSPTPPAEPAAERELDLSPNAVGDVESEEVKRAFDNGDGGGHRSTTETQPPEVAAVEVDTESVSREGEVEMPDFEDTVGGGADATWGQESTRPIQEDDIARIFE
jgi:hypothetical protein